MQVTDLRVTGKYRQIDGIMETTWKDSYLITKEVLDELLWKSHACWIMHSLHYRIMQLIGEWKFSTHDNSENAKEAEIKELQWKLFHTETMLKWLAEKNYKLRVKNQKLKEKLPDYANSQKSKENKERAHRERTAAALALAIKGNTTKEISAQLEERRLGGSTTAVSKLISVLKGGDRERLLSIILEFPDEFNGIEDDDFERWFEERYEKTKHYRRGWGGSTKGADKSIIAEAEAVIRKAESQAAEPVRQEE